MAKRILVLLIEDNRLVRDGLVSLLNGQPDLKVVAPAEAATIGLQRIQRTKPDVVLVDASLGNVSSHRIVQSVRKATPEAKVIVMDLLPAQKGVIEFIEAGASGFIVKDATVEDFLGTIRSVAEGANVVPPALTGTLLSHIADQADIRNRQGTTEAVRMTRREREVTDLVSEGLSNKEIAQRLKLATYTIKSHLHNILEKLALHRRLQIADPVHEAGVPPADSGTSTR